MKLRDQHHIAVIHTNVHAGLSHMTRNGTPNRQDSVKRGELTATYYKPRRLQDTRHDQLDLTAGVTLTAETTVTNVAYCSQPVKHHITRHAAVYISSTPVSAVPIA